MSSLLKYVEKSTYQFELDEDRLELLTGKTNRSKGQTQFLFNLIGGDFEKLKQLELSLKNSLYGGGCPDTLEEVENVLNRKNVCTLLTLEL